MDSVSESLILSLEEFCEVGGIEIIFLLMFNSLIQQIDLECLVPATYFPW